MSTWVKICGLTSREAVAAAVEGGADAIGFVFAASPRQVSPAQARRLCEGYESRVTRVAVMRHPLAAAWQAVQEEFAPDWVQTDAEDFGALSIDDNRVKLPVYRDDRCSIDDDPDILPPLLLFEGEHSGAGRRADWDVAAVLARRTRLILAGGLAPQNVADALGAVRPWGVDVSSGVEVAPGTKDPARIAEFVTAVRRWERQRQPGEARRRNP